MARLADYLNLQGPRYYFAVGLSILISLLGILGGACNPHPSDRQFDLGQRGGAIGVGISFLIFFRRKNLAEWSYRWSLSKPPSLIDKETCQLTTVTLPLNEKELTRISFAIDTRFNVEAKEQSLQNLALAIASVIATIVWGFGDWFAYDIHWHFPRECVFVGVHLEFVFTFLFGPHFSSFS
jgi:hypothetical protein